MKDILGRGNGRPAFKEKKMEKIRVHSEGALYSILSIERTAAHVIRIAFAEDAVPEGYGDISVYTAGGELCAELPGFSTVYRDEGQVVYLSDDGSVYEEPENPGELPSEPYEPTFAELQAAKKAEISADCEKIIASGINVTLSDGSTEHFALTEHDQLNLFGVQANLAAGAEQVAYHADGKACRYFGAADAQKIVTAAMKYVSYHTTYCNSVNQWIAGCETAEQLQEVFYGADVPEEYQSDVLKAYLKEIAGSAGEADAEQASE